MSGSKFNWACYLLLNLVVLDCSMRSTYCTLHIRLACRTLAWAPHGHGGGATGRQRPLRSPTTRVTAPQRRRQTRRTPVTPPTARKGRQWRKTLGHRRTGWSGSSLTSHRSTCLLEFSSCGWPFAHVMVLCIFSDVVRMMPYCAAKCPTLTGKLQPLVHCFWSRVFGFAESEL